MNITIRKPRTMASLQPDFDTLDRTNTNDILKNYEKSIIIMTKNLENKDRTIQKMTEEFEENEIMFNDLLKENTRIKRELCENKNKMNSLEDALKELQHTNEMLEESEYKSYQLFQPLHHKLNTLEREKEELQSKYSQLLIHNMNRHDIKNRNSNKKSSLKLRKKKKSNEKRLKYLIKIYKKEKRINNNLNKKNHIYDESIKHLNNEMIILTNSILERDKLLRDLQTKLNEAIQLAENNIINKSRYSEQLQIIKELEITILQLQEFVNNKISAGQEVLNDRKNEKSEVSKGNEKIAIKIVGDYFVRNLGSKLKENFGTNFEIDCNVFTNTPIKYILSSAQDIINKCRSEKTTILMVLIQNFSKEDFKTYLSTIKQMTDSIKDTNIKLVFSNIPYEEKSVNINNNFTIQKINSILNCIAFYENNLNLFNISNIITRGMRRDQYQNIVLYFLKAMCKNYGYLNNQDRDFTKNFTLPMNT